MRFDGSPQEILKQMEKRGPEFKGSLPPEFKDLVKWMLSYDPNMRPATLDCLAHTFFLEIDFKQM